jgi:flagellum-specific peptidoglycan hydrolase FlgJ
MTTKSKAAKPAVVNTIIAKPEYIALAKKAGQSAGTIATMRLVVNEACKALHAAKVTVGQSRTCEIAKAFLAERFKGKAAKPAVKAQILSCFRKAVESGAPYNENASKAKAKAKAAATKNDAPKAADAVEAKPAPTVVTKPAKDDETTIILALPRKSNAKQASKQMRAFVEKMRQSESLAPLAAYIVDVLDEFDGTAEQF